MHQQVSDNLSDIVAKAKTTSRDWSLNPKAVGSLAMCNFLNSVTCVSLSRVSAWEVMQGVQVKQLWA